MIVILFAVSELNLIFLLSQRVCVPRDTVGCRDECDLLVPGEQRGDTSPAPPRNDLCGPGRL